MIQYADVVVDIPFEQDSLTYRIPMEFSSAQVGSRVIVDVRGRDEVGIIYNIHPLEPSFSVKPIKKLIDKEPIITEEQWKIAKWMQETYVSSLGEAVFRMVPHGRMLKKNPEIPIENQENIQDLNTEQKKAYESILNTIGKPSVHLLYGITGSGKTEVYIHVIKHILEKTNQSVIFLVPEITLSYHLIHRLSKIFPKDITLFHSSLKISEKYLSYQNALKKIKRIVIGTRSAIFAPVRDLGLIILDEEHDSSYKENSSPRYHARQVAYHRIQESKATLILGSATPSIESFYHAKTGKIHLHILSKRAVPESNLPTIQIVEKKESEGPISYTLVQEIRNQIANKEQTILLLNRRGYSPLIYNRETKKFLECPNCSTNLCFHKPNLALCHICNHKELVGDLRKKPSPLELMGMGTQKLEEYLLNQFPNAKVERLDHDVSRDSSLMAEILDRLYHNEIDILTGTQLVAKGLDIPNLTLVGMLNATQGLAVPDFRAPEKVFSLITQVAGRAGRRSRPGRVVIEATIPNHPILLKAMNQDYVGFYEEEIQHRKEMNLPPFSRLLRLLVRSTNLELAEREIQKIFQLIQETKDQDTTILGPSPCPIHKIEKNYRYHMLLKSKTHQPTREIVKKIKREWSPPKNVYLEIDFDPVDVM